MDTAGIMDKKGQIRFNDDSNGILYELVNMGKPVAVHLTDRLCRRSSPHTSSIPALLVLMHKMENAGIAYFIVDRIRLETNQKGWVMYSPAGPSSTPPIRTLVKTSLQ